MPRRISKSTPTPTRKKDLPATVGFVEKVRDELKADIRALDHKMNGRFNEAESRFGRIDARFNKIDARFNKIDARFNEIDARFNEIDARFKLIDARFDKQDEKIDKVLSSVHRLEAMWEQQYSENRIVLEELKNLRDRQSRLEIRQDYNDEVLRDFAKFLKQANKSNS